MKLARDQEPVVGSRDICYCGTSPYQSWQDYTVPEQRRAPYVSKAFSSVSDSPIIGDGATKLGITTYVVQ